MKFTVYKGFDIDFLKSLDSAPLVDDSIEKKKNVIQYNRSFRKQLEMALISMNENDHFGMTYEEYSLVFFYEINEGV